MKRITKCGMLHRNFNQEFNVKILKGEDIDCLNTYSLKIFEGDGQ
jgi:RNAse (barnase) inhibitor barstar